ncbi:MAG: dephospho-CoA kinase [Tenuifilaceae bacterium]
MLKVGVTGGIGSGKTLVCSIISSMGYPVFNADYEARQIVDNDLKVISSIKMLFGDDIYVDGFLDRKRVASIVFTDKFLLEKLNSIIHPAVIEHFNNWVFFYDKKPMVIKEAAILFESGADKGLDKIIAVSAPLEVRVNRVRERDGIDTETILKRVSNQFPQDEILRRSDFVIENDGINLILPQIVNILKKLLNDY